MSDPRVPVECYVCGQPIENPYELMVTTAGWEDDEFTVPCHWECMLDGTAAAQRSI